MSHAKIAVKIKDGRRKVKVDVNMVEIVNWLNSFKSITTYDCCEGDDNPYSLPYVSFIGSNQECLGEVVKAIQRYAFINVIYRKYKSKQINMIYIVRFDSVRGRERFSKYVKNIKKSVRLMYLNSIYGE